MTLYENYNNGKVRYHYRPAEIHKTIKVILPPEIKETKTIYGEILLEYDGYVFYPYESFRKTKNNKLLFINWITRKAIEVLYKYVD